MFWRSGMLHKSVVREAPHGLMDEPFGMYGQTLQQILLSGRPKSLMGGRGSCRAGNTLVRYTENLRLKHKVVFEGRLP